MNRNQKNQKNIFIFYGDPNIDSSTSLILNAYTEGVTESKIHNMRITKLSDMKFNPSLEKGYKEIQQLEPDLVKFQNDIKWANTIVFIYPNWWCAMPAKMKGIFDKCFSITYKSDNDNSVLIISKSLNGDISPSVWIISFESKTRITCAIAFVLLMCDKNSLPSPSPNEAPETSPAISTKETVAFIVFFELENFVNFSKRESGTGTTPTDGSIVQNG